MISNIIQTFDVAVFNSFFYFLLYLNCTFNKTEVHKVTNIKSKNLRLFIEKYLL